MAKKEKKVEKKDYSKLDKKIDALKSIIKKVEEKKKRLILLTIINSLVFKTNRL